MSVSLSYVGFVPVKNSYGVILPELLEVQTRNQNLAEARSFLLLIFKSEEKAVATRTPEGQWSI